MGGQKAAEELVRASRVSVTLQFVCGLLAAPQHASPHA
jgi:hypothetical protein